MLVSSLDKPVESVGEMSRKSPNSLRISTSQPAKLPLVFLLFLGLSASSGKLQHRLPRVISVPKPTTISLKRAPQVKLPLVEPRSRTTIWLFSNSAAAWRRRRCGQTAPSHSWETSRS